MIKITGLSHLFKWENLHNWWLTKYFFAPLYIKDVTKYDSNMQADTVKMAIKKLTNTLEKHMHHFQCQQSEFKCKKVPNISDRNKQRN